MNNKHMENDYHISCMSKGILVVRVIGQATQDQVSMLSAEVHKLTASWSM